MSSNKHVMPSTVRVRITESMIGPMKRRGLADLQDAINIGKLVVLDSDDQEALP